MRLSISRSTSPDKDIEDNSTETPENDQAKPEQQQKIVVKTPKTPVKIPKTPVKMPKTPTKMPKTPQKTFKGIYDGQVNILVGMTGAKRAAKKMTKNRKAPIKRRGKAYKT